MECQNLSTFFFSSSHFWLPYNYTSTDTMILYRVEVCPVLLLLGWRYTLCFCCLEESLYYKKPMNQFSGDSCGKLENHSPFKNRDLNCIRIRVGQLSCLDLITKGKKWEFFHSCIMSIQKLHGVKLHTYLITSCCIIS